MSEATTVTERVGFQVVLTEDWQPPEKFAGITVRLLAHSIARARNAFGFYPTYRDDLMWDAETRRLSYVAAFETATKMSPDLVQHLQNATQSHVTRLQALASFRGYEATDETRRLNDLADEYQAAEDARHAAIVAEIQPVVESAFGVEVAA